VRYIGREYEPVQAVQCCKKAAYCAFNNPSDNKNPVPKFLASFNYLRHVDDSDMVGMTIQNQVNQNNKPIRISFRLKDQCSADVISRVFEKDPH